MKKEFQYDFEGWATRNDILCDDGRTIRRNAFKECDGKIVPLVWQHKHESPEYVLGHCLLENREDGMWTYGKFNDSDLGKKARADVIHGDITNMSIWANKLVQKGGDVMHGVIREVSLVLSGANKGATIEAVAMAHAADGDPGVNIYGYDEGECTLVEGSGTAYYEAEEELKHETEPEEKKSEQGTAPCSTSFEGLPDLFHATGEGRTIGDVINEMTDEQKKVVAYVLDKGIEIGEANANNQNEESEEDEGETEMSHNAFEANETRGVSEELMKTIFAEAKQRGSLKDAVLSHMEDDEGLMHTVKDRFNNTVTYGIADIDYLFPDARTLANTPEFIKRDTSWVDSVIRGTKHSPFSRVKSVYADITMEEARARGYIKGQQKVEEVFALLKRTTDPQTVYKLQKMDRDDIIDITDLNVVAWIKGEMRMMLNEEIARAILIGDGRTPGTDYKISEDHIRSIWHDNDLFTIPVDVVRGETEGETANNLIKAVLRARKNYKGSGNPTFYTTEDVLTELMLLEDGIGRRMYQTKQDVATALRVSNIETVEVMENQTGTRGDLAGIIVNLNDYNVGADKGGEVSLFDDFDIKYNQYLYLIETRISGALVKPHSAMAIEFVDSSNS